MGPPIIHHAIGCIFEVKQRGIADAFRFPFSAISLSVNSRRAPIRRYAELGVHFRLHSKCEVPISVGKVRVSTSTCLRETSIKFNKPTLIPNSCYFPSHKNELFFRFGIQPSTDRRAGSPVVHIPRAFKSNYTRLLHTSEMASPSRRTKKSLSASWLEAHDDS